MAKTSNRKEWTIAISASIAISIGITYLSFTAYDLIKFGQYPYVLKTWIGVILPAIYGYLAFFQNTNKYLKRC